MMVLDRIAAGQTNWEAGLKDLPMHISGAAGTKRGLEALDQRLEQASPNAAALVRKFMPSIAALRQKEAGLIRKWMETMKSQSDGLYKDKGNLEQVILKSMNLFYGNQT